MNFIAIKMLIGDKLKYFALVAGVSFAALLITQQASIFAGYALSTSAWIRDTAVADLWVMDEQVEFPDDVKPISDTALGRVRGIEGVAWAVPMYKNYLRARLSDGTLLQTRVVGLDDATLVGAPPEIVEGKLEDLRGDRAVFINADQAATLLKLKRGGGQPMKVGDRFTLNDSEVIVAGTYRSTREFFWEPVLYTTYSKAISWAPRERKVLNYVLVKAKDGQSHAELARRIEAATGYRALTNQEFDRQTMSILLDKTGILVNFGITIALGFVIGLLVAGQTFYTFVLDNLRHFAALKAMGAGNATVLRMLFMQVLLVGTIGYGLGVGGASITGVMFAKAGLLFQMAWQIPVVGMLAVLLCCTGAGFLGMIRVLRLEPSIVFR